MSTTLSKIIAVVSEVFETAEEELRSDLRFVEDLGATSLDVVTLIWRVEEVFGLGEIEESVLEKLSTVGDLAELVRARTTMVSEALEVVDLAVASDHAGLQLKTALLHWLREKGYSVSDLGPALSQSVDYPDFAHRVTRAIAEGSAQKGLLICGSGIGMSIAANKAEGIRAVVVANSLQARLCREHNDANVLCLGERLTGVDMARECLEAFLTTPFKPGDDGRHQRRVKKLTLEAMNYRPDS